ncbi:MAG: PaaI family thioesterase [Candidatus Omnitrophota bacterium]|nr:MAG: PaaI family thioesterase [Candidatus Omnitrophota bacterium]
MKVGKNIHVQNCFGCSPQNPIGLKISFEVNSDAVRGEFTSNKDHEGPPGFVHGGILAAILDEALSYIARSSMQHGIRTMKETITFRNASSIGEKLEVIAHIKEEKSRAFVVTAKVLNHKGIVAEAEGTLLKVRETVAE